MKTFSEACEATLIRTVPMDVPVDEAKVVSEIKGRIEPFLATLKEVQHSPEAFSLAVALLHLANEQDIDPVVLICIAFAQGVMVGIEMEKAPLLVGRDTPHEVRKPTEAKK